jgi:alpha-glucosidase (family GH31 glycosyl hydrolase)
MTGRVTGRTRLARLTTRPRRLITAAAATVTMAGLIPAVAAMGGTTARTEAAGGGAQLTADGNAVTLTVPPSPGAPGYGLTVTKSPLQLTTERAGHTVLATTAATAPAPGPFDFHTASGWYSATAVTSVRWQAGVLGLTLATTEPGATLQVQITPQPDRYRITSTVSGGSAPDSTGMHYTMSSAGHWYGQGEATTDDGAPYTRQPWPLDSASGGRVYDNQLSPSEYQMTDPFWFTQSSAGIWFNTGNVMNDSLGYYSPGIAGFEVTGTGSLDTTVFVQSTPRAVYQDYIGITGTPASAQATAQQFREPLWNSWGQFYTTVSEPGILAYAKALHDAGVPGHSIQIDDGWMGHYGDFDFNSKFPTPKQMSAEIHQMGFDLGLWVTLWINKDASNFNYAESHGYLLKSKADPSQACLIPWWDGPEGAGIVDLANPAARDWLAGQLKQLESAYNVNGFKFDTRFFDPSCQPDAGYTANDYLRLGAQFTGQFNQQGVGVRISWTGSQKYGFVTRQIDKGTSWDSLQAAVAQNLANSTIGYPFVETDMIGGSLGQPPPVKDVLIRWAQAAALMPLMYSSTSPLGVSNPDGSQSYDQQTVDLYKAAIGVHERLTPYILEQVSRAVKTGEPIMKPIFFDFPGDQSSYTIADEWLLGDSLLAAPVTSEATSRDIHLPPGEWYDVASHRVLSGPAELSGYGAGLNQTPMFIRLGTPDTGKLMSALAG